jgi:hypothetical protein
VGHLYAVFSYDQMIPGVQWTAIWYRDDLIVHHETKPWDGGTGGYGFTDWYPEPDKWIPGNYRVAIFVGMEFKIAGQFSIYGDAPAGMPTPMPSTTPLVSSTLPPSSTSGSTITPSVTQTP